MRIGWVLGLAILMGTAWLLFEQSTGFGQTTWAQSAENRSIFYRLLANYQHGEETVEFNVVVGCAVRVTNYAAGGSSYDAFRRPRVFAKATRDGGAIWQLIPNACGGETTANGKVPKDFLPGAVWFDSKDDFSFGVAYLTEDAFGSPSSKLKFLGAQIHSATAQEYQDFQPMMEANLFEPEALAVSGPRLTDEEAKAILHDKAKIAEALRSSFGCYGYVRYRLSGLDARAVLQEFWPADHPRFWALTGAAREELLRRLTATNNGDGLLLDGILWKRHFSSFWEPQAKGFPTRVGGGVMKTGRPSPIAPTLFPLNAEDSLAGITSDTAASNEIRRRFSTDINTARGFAYCFSRLSPNNPITSLLIPNYSTRSAVLLGDGELVEVNETGSARAIPDFVYERDEFMYRRFQIGLE